MKSIFLFLIVFLTVLGGCSPSPSPPVFTAAISIETSDIREPLVTVEPLSEFFLDFSLPLDQSTIDGNVSLHIVQNGGGLVATNPPVRVVFDARAPNRLTVKTVDGSKLPSGEEYRLTVGGAIRSTSGMLMDQDCVRYFVVNTSPLWGLVAGLPEDRTITVVISDIHLGDQRSIDESYGWFNRNKSLLVNFLNYVRLRPDVKELVIAGDMFDEWVAPVDHDTFGGVGQSAFVDKIAAANSTVIQAVNAIIQDGDIQVTYVPGNHDMLVEASDIERVLPGITQARDGVKGLGAYTPLGYPDLIIEHGHRYDFFNAPDPLSNRSITGTDSILSPGFFVSKIAATSDLERGQASFYRDGLNTTAAMGPEAGNYFSYWAAWLLIMSQKPVQESWDQKMIVTAADGYAGVYSINDLIPQYLSGSGPLNVTLYKEIIDNWNLRQTANKVAVPILAEVAITAGALNRILDAQSVTQYFLNTASNKRIVVFGHTHDAYLFSVLNHQGQWSVYANSGTWVDAGKVSCTFVEIRPRKGSGTSDTVTVYQYVNDDDIRKIKGAALRK